MNTATSKTIKALLFVAVTLGILVVLYSLVFRVDWSGSASYKAQFDFIGTVMVGSPVRKSGVKIGSVAKIEINTADQKTVFVTMSIYPGQVIRSGDRVGIVSGGILGDQFVEIFPGDPGLPVLGKNDLIKAEKGLDLRSLAIQGEEILGDVGSVSRILADFLKNNQESLNKSVKNLEILTGNLAVMTTDALSLPAVVEREIIKTSTTLNNSLERILAQAQETLVLVNSSLGAGGQDIQKTLKNLGSISEDMKTLLSNLNTDEGILSLFKSKDLAQSIDATLKNIRSSSESLKRVADALAASFKP